MSSRWPTLTSWHADWTGVRVAVLGLDAEGFSVADTLAELGSDVTVLSYGGHAPDREELLSVIGVELARVASDSEARARLAELAPEVVIVAGEFGPGHPLVEWALASGIPVANDLELAWRLGDKTGLAAPWLLLAGAHEPGRTAHLTESMLLAAGVRAMACGSTAAQVPVLDAVRLPEGWECLVVATTPDALYFASSLSPLASTCLTSAAVDGADRSVDLARVYEGTQVACVYNRDDAGTMRMVEDADVVEGCRAVGFGLGIPGPSDFGVVEGILCDRAFLDDRHASALEFATVDLLATVGLGGRDGVADVLAAAALARAFGVPIAAVNAALSRADELPE